MYRTVDTATWDDPWFAELNPQGKLFFLYLLTNRRSTSCGAFEITVRQMVFETGLAADVINGYLTSWRPRVQWWEAHSIVWVRNFYRYQVVNDKMRTNARSLVAKLPAEIRAEIGKTYPELLPAEDTVSIPDAKGMHKGNSNSNNNSNKEKQQPQHRADAREEPPPSGKATYADVLNGALPSLLTMLQQIDKQFTDGWLKTMLVAAESEVGPLPRDRLGKGLDLAVDQIKRQVETGTVRNPRMFARKVIVDYLMEQRNDRPRP